MKKLLIKSFITTALLIAGNQANAQSGIGNLLKSITGTKDNTSTTGTSSSTTGSGIISTLTNIFSSKLTATKDQIIGTWVYEEPAVVMSSENTLKNLGGKIAASTMESKLKEKMEAYGLKKGCVTMTFDESGIFTQTFNGKTLKGTYTIEDKNINLKYAGKVSQIVGTTQLDGNNLLIVMDASKLLTYVNVLGSYAQSTTMKTATSLIGSMDGLECGLKLVKQ